MDRYQNLDLDLESGAVPQKSVLFKGMFKKSKSGEQPVQTEESLFTDSELSKSEESLNDSNNTKNKGGLIKGMFKKTTKTSKEDQPQANLSPQSPKLSTSSDSLTGSSKLAKDKSGVTLKQTPKGERVRRSSEDLLDNKFSVSKDSPLQNNNTKESGGGFGGVIKKLSKPFGGRTRSQDNLSEPSELSSSNDDLSTHDNTEEVKSKMIQQETKERHEPPPVPPKPTTEEIKNIAVYDKVKQRQAEDNQQSQTDDEGLKEEEDELKSPVRKTKAASDDRRVEQQEKSSSKEERKEEAAKEKPEKAKVMKLKKQNPFMPQVKAKLIQRGTKTEPTGDRAESEGGSRSLLDQLDDLRIEPPKPEDSQDVDLMEWWNTVESWEDMPNDKDMTEKEEAKAFAVTADKVQKGIRVFNKLFSERAESLWQHVMDLNSIADALDKFNKNTKIAQITGGSTSAVGGIATIAGLALAPFTMGTSLIVTAVGLGVATAGSLTSAGAGISNQVNNSMDRKKVEKIVEDYQEKILDLNKCLKFIQQGIENLRKFDLIKMKQRAYNQDFPVLTSSLYEDGAMAGKAILTNANEIMRVVQIAHVAGSTAARAVQVASMATGVLTGLFVGMDIYFVAKDSKELKKGAKSEFAGKIRQVVTQLHDGLVELNGIRVELQASAQADTKKAASDSDRKDNDYRKDDDDDEEDEIDRIKKALKKDIESREYV